MNQSIQNITSDLTFIGSGIATSFTLTSLLKQLENDSMLTQPIDITIVEKGDEFHTGLAYGPTSGPSALLITSLADFLPDGEERKEFLEWLSVHKDALISKLLEDGGDLSKNWVNTHKEDINSNNWEDIYLPRRFFGTYIKQKLEFLIEASQKQNKTVFTYINDEVVSVNRSNEIYELNLKSSSQKLASKQVVVSVGIPPIRELWSDAQENELSRSACLISNPYSSSLNANLTKIQDFIETKNTSKTNVLIIGSNASAMEMIYKLNDVDLIKSRLSNIYVVSPQGELPNSAQDESTKQINFLPSHLLSLTTHKDLTALDIFNAANLDLDRAEHLGYGTAISEVPVSKAFGALLKKLNAHELKEFACHYGNEIGKRQRRAGKHYTDVVDHLKSEGRLTNISGYFQSIKSSKDYNGVQFSYNTKSDKETITFSKNVHIVLNCIGGRSLNNTPITPLLDDLISKQICSPNPSMRGFVVNDHLEASENFYVAGPLLAGNLIQNTPLWHIEHCGRIIFLGKALATSIYSKLSN